MLTLERKMVRQARQLSQQKGFSIPKEQLSQLSQQHGLTQEQTKGLEHACNDSGFNALLGSAGVGKTRLMLAVNQAYQENGFKIIGTTIAKVAADQLAKESGITSFTTAKLLTDIESGRLALDNKSVVVVDEAGQQGVRQLEALITAVRQAGSKLICVGDQEQLDAIELGGSLRFLSNSLGCHRMTRIQRQDEEWARQAVMSFRDGQALDALKTHAEHKQLHFSDSADASKDLLIKQWQAYQSDGKTSIVLAQRWADVKGLNERIRAIYQEQGTVGQQNIERECVVSDRSITFAFSVGERIKFTKNDYRKNLSNGLLGTVESITELEDGDLAFVILADDGRKVHFNASEYSDDQGRLQLAQAYSLTLYSSQGVTVDNTFIYHTPSMDRANTYVAASRHRSDCHFYMNDAALRELSESGRNGDIMDSNERLQTLAKLMSTDRHQRLAIDYLPANEREPEQQLKQEKHEELEMA
jgi:ATP-dependent exoDNAse (exonuclease V) alpha subunit